MLESGIFLLDTMLTAASAWLAGALLLGMANVVVQFTSAHTDLFTTGIWAGAIYLWLCQLQRSESSLLGGVGAGLALGSKGTIIYFAPTAAVYRTKSFRPSFTAPAAASWPEASSTACS